MSRIVLSVHRRFRVWIRGDRAEPTHPAGVRFFFYAGHWFGKLFLKKWDEAAAFGGTDAAAPVCNLKKHLDAAGRHVAFFRESLIWKKLDFCGIA